MLSMQNQNGNLLSMNSDLHFVSGMSEARNYMTRNNSKTALFDKDDDIMYIVDTDGFAVYNELQKRFPNSNINSVIDNMKNIYNSI